MNDKPNKEIDTEALDNDPSAAADERERLTKMVPKQKVMETVKKSFEFAHEQLAGRTLSEQSIIGNMLTTLELELKKDLKAL